MKLLTFFILIGINYLYPIDKSSYFASGKKFDAKHFVVPHENTDSIYVYVFFRISNETLNYKKTGSGENISYQTNVSLEIKALDNSGITRYSQPYNDLKIETTYENTISKTKYYYGYLKLSLFNRKHTIKLSFDDTKNFNQLYEELDQLVFDYNSRINSNPLFLYKYDRPVYTESKFFINKSGYNFGPYSSRLIFPSNGFQNEALSYKVEKIKENDTEKDIRSLFEWKSNIVFEGDINIINYNDVEFSKKNDEIYISITRNSKKYQFLEVNLPEDKILPGFYSLKLFSDGQEIIQHNFKVIWESKPISLDDPSFAIKKMYYILDDERYESMNSGSEEEKSSKLLNFWQAKDPTPNTPFNEAMYQYFSRVDFAYFNLATLAQKDGAETDRGKIFILKGTPDEIINKSIGSSRYEIWTYNNLKERYKFKLIQSGVFLLEEIEKIE